MNGKIEITRKEIEELPSEQLMRLYDYIRTEILKRLG